MIENDAVLIERMESDELEDRVSVISRRTWIAGIAMLLALVTGGSLDYLAQAGKLGDAADLVLAGLTLVPLVVAAIILPVSRSFAKGVIRTQWSLFGLGMLSVGVGNVIFIVLYLITGSDPYPSVADVFTLTGYACFAAGFVYAIRAYRGLLDIRKPLLIAGGIAVLAMVFVYASVIGPYVVFDPTGDQSLATRVLNTAYPVLDVFVLFMPAVTLGLIASRLGAGRLAWPAWFVVGSAGTLAVIDTVFAFATFIGARRTPLIDSGYALAPMLLGFAVLVARDVYRS